MRPEEAREPTDESSPIPRERIPDFEAWGIEAFVTTRQAGTFGMGGAEPVGEVVGRWRRLADELRPTARRLVVARQVHGRRVLTHLGGWDGFLLAGDADGHFTTERGTALAVTIADCVPVLLAHESGAIAALHSGWRGTVERIVDEGIRPFGRMAIPPDEIAAYLGPGICGRCYEVSGEVRSQLTGVPASRAGHVDLRTLIAEQLGAAGVRRIAVSAHCTRCDNDRYYSHRAGDSGRQIAVLALSL